MSARFRTRLAWIVTMAAWAVLGVDALQLLRLTDSLSRFTLGVAGCGIIILTVSACSRPAAEVYQMGFEAGQRQAKIDAAVSRTGDVVPFRQAR